MTRSQKNTSDEETRIARVHAEQKDSIGRVIKKICRKLKRRLSRLKPGHWFWITIGVLLVFTMGLRLLGVWQMGRNGTESSREEEPRATWLEHEFKEADEKAGEVKAGIDQLLDQAYAPVYAGIPAYMDFHYSLKGEWLELGATALGEIGGGLDKYLFAGLDERLEEGAQQLGRDFDIKYLAVLDEAMAHVPDGTAALGPVVLKAIDDAKSRTTKTAGAYAGVMLGGASVKAMTKVFAKKLGIKLAAKVAAKTGTKWGVAAGGAGTGAALCSWAGPGAAGCAVVGAAITWVGVDLVMVKLDEYVTREDFEHDLREMIDLQKQESRHALEKMLDGKTSAARSSGKASVQDVALSELKDAEKLLACQAAQDIWQHYSTIQGNLQARSPENIEDIRQRLKERAENQLLAPWIEKMEAEIPVRASRIWVGDDVNLTIVLPLELQNEREVRATLRIGQKTLDFGWSQGHPTGHFELKARPTEGIFLKGSQHIALTLFQDRGLFHMNRIFAGDVKFTVFEALAEGSGTAPTLSISLPMISAKSAGPVPSATLQLPLGGELLFTREMPSFCTD